MKQIARNSQLSSLLPTSRSQFTVGSNMQCYSVKRLSPFQGSLQIVDDKESRAFTNNGYKWHIQIKHHLAKPQWRNLENLAFAQKYIRFGIWSEQNGLNRFPIPPTLDIDRVNTLANKIITTLKSNLHQLPFESRDFYEHWLLDCNRQLPAALLASTSDETRIDRSYVPEWLACNNEMLTLTQVQSDEVPFERLESLLKAKSGDPPYSQWFKRLADGSGVGLFGHRIDRQNQQRHLPADEFPATLLKSDWQDQKLNEITSIYMRWQAPYLLTLNNLPDDLRAKLEEFACDKPLVVFELHRLYPKIIQTTLIKRAIVEAQLRLTQI